MRLNNLIVALCSIARGVCLGAGVIYVMFGIVASDPQRIIAGALCCIAVGVLKDSVEVVM